MLRPQKGPQEQFLASSADVVVYGGSAGGGKSWALLMEPLRHIHRPRFTGVIFRETYPQIKNPGGLWDNVMAMYPQTDAQLRDGELDARWNSGARLKFGYMEHEKHKLQHQGAEYAFIGFDELTHFSYTMFMYMLSRNRSMCGIKPYIRATTNPDADSWVRKIIDWWIGDDGYPIPERSGVVRFFAVIADVWEWADTPEELIERFGEDVQPKSFTFIAASLADNKALMDKDPGYLANLKALPKVERERLLGGNWNIRPAAGLLFRREWFEIVKAVPADVPREVVRYWDRAATPETQGNNPDWTVGVKMSRTKQGVYYVENVVRFREAPMGVERAIRNTATQDNRHVKIGLEQDPGQAGKAEVQYLIRALQGFNARAYPVQKDKETRAAPYSAQVEAGNVKIVAGPWNDAYFSELESFPDENDNAKDDQVDASSGAFQMLTKPHAARVVKTTGH